MEKHFFRLRCILAPKAYLKEWLIKYSNVVILLMWILGLGFWAPIVYFFNYKFWSNGQCLIDYNDNKSIGISIVLIGYHVPLFFNLGTSIFVLVNIGRAKGISKQSVRTNLSTRGIRNETGNTNSYLNKIVKLIFNNPQVKLSIITFVFTLCYLPYSFELLLETACSCERDLTSLVTDLICFSASMWNPLLILILNYKYFIRESNSNYIHK